MREAILKRVQRLSHPDPVLGQRRTLERRYACADSMRWTRRARRTSAARFAMSSASGTSGMIGKNGMRRIALRVEHSAFEVFIPDVDATPVTRRGVTQSTSGYSSQNA